MAQPSPNPLKIMAFHNDKRQAGRLAVSGIQSHSSGRSFGEVLNVSHSGVLVMRHKRLKLNEHERVAVRLACDEYEIDVYVKIAWAKRVGIRKWLYGLSYGPLSERDQMVVNKMAMQAGANQNSSQLRDAG